jgi:hypothetical protein
MVSALFNLISGRIQRSVRAIAISAMLAVIALVALLTGLGFALSLLYVWLAQLYGTMTALAIVAGGCAAVALLLFALAFARRGRRSSGPQSANATGQRTVDEAIAAVQQGSRESMLAALALAVVAGMTLGRKL